MIAAALRLAVLSLCLLATGAAAQNSSDRLPDTSLSVDGGTIDLVFADGAPGLDRALITDWICTSAKAVSTYFGGFPVSHVRLMVIADNGHSVNGTTFGSPQGSFIRLRVGTLADAAALKDDWVLVHEMNSSGAAAIAALGAMAAGGQRHLCGTDCPRPGRSAWCCRSLEMDIG